MTTKLLLFVLAIGLAVGSASAGILYTINDTTNSLYTVDQTTGAVSLVGSTGVATGEFGDLTYNPLDGKLYWVPGRGNDSLYTIDPATGLATLVGDHGINDLFALAWDSTNQVLYADSGDGNLYTLNPLTGAPTLVGSNGIYPGGLVYNSLLDSLLLLHAGSDELYMVDRTSGATTLVAGGRNYVDDNGVTYDSEHDTYWVSGYSPGLFQYDSSFNLLNSYPPTDRFDGIAFAANIQAGAGPSVPEPTSFLLIGTGLIAAALFRRKAR